MDFKDAEWQINRIMGQLGRAIKTICPHCGHKNPANQCGCNKCGKIYNPPLKSESMTKPEQEGDP